MRTSRKLDHLKLALESNQNVNNSFQNVHFVHQALPNVALDKISLATMLGGLNISSPIIINAMTGGAVETTEINEKLAIIARETGLALAVGSQMSAIKNKELINTYKVVRKVNPNGIIFANLGMEATLNQALEAIDMLNADALQIHLNVVQELVMPEGDRNFEGVLDRLQAIKEGISVPLMVKEVGFGISLETAKKLADRGIKIIDVGGKGGTNFAKIENSRREASLPIFNDWGIDTAASILEVRQLNDIELVATGGIKNSLQIAIAMGLGANAVGIVGSILRSLTNEGIDGTIRYIDNLHTELKLIMTSLGASNSKELQQKPIVISGELKNWCDLRGINLKALAQRGQSI